MSESSEKCKHNRNEFCFVCGLRIFYTTDQKREEVLARLIDTPKFIEGYKHQFKYEPKSSDRSPYVSCTNCYKTLTSKKKLRLSSPMVWNKPKNHPDECYFC